MPKPMRTAAALLIASLALAGCGGTGTAQSRVGVYDSRAIALVYWTGKRLDAHHGALLERIDQAKAAGDQKQAAKLDTELWAHRKLVHLQGFSTEPVDDILDKIRDRLPAIKRRANVEAIVSKWDEDTLSRYKPANRVDITLLLVAEYEPRRKRLQMVWDLYQHDPIPRWMMKLYFVFKGH